MSGDKARPHEADLIEAIGQWPLVRIFCLSHQSVKSLFALREERKGRNLALFGLQFPQEAGLCHKLFLLRLRKTKKVS
jgi:hypothetical protein